MKYQMTLLIYVGLLLVFQTPVDAVCGIKMCVLRECAHCTRVCCEIRSVHVSYILKVTYI